jgi:predicted nucleic acid-binding Zn ribbon protein
VTDERATTDSDADAPDSFDTVTGMDLVRRTLEDARGVARGAGKDIGHGRRLAHPRWAAGTPGRRRWSGPGPDTRDPQPLGAAAREVGRKRGWSPRVAEGAVLVRWSSIVGPHIADHARPATLRDGVLNVSAESTAWATQLRIIQGQLLARIAAAVGDGVVRSLKITGPQAPSWRKGPLHIAGRGPRDTYG